MALPTNPMGGFTTGQLLGELIQDQKDQDSKTKRRRNLAMGVSLLLGGGDAMLRNKHQDVINKLDESKVTDIAKNSKMFDDATELQTVQESIDSYGGGLTGALAHYDPKAELAFDATHRNNLKYFTGPNVTESALTEKQKWKESFIRDNLYKKHELEYKGIDAKTISGLSREEYNRPINEYYAAKIDQANNPANKSMIHKGFQKGAEILGFRTKEDTLTDKVLEEQIDYNNRNNKIQQYRDFDITGKITVPTNLTKNTIEGLTMNESEFYQAWQANSQLNPKYAPMAYERFKEQGGRILDFQSAVTGYLGQKALRDTEVSRNEAVIKVQQTEEYKGYKRKVENAIANKTVDSEAQDNIDLLEKIAIAEVLGGNANSMKLHMESRRAVAELIEVGKYKLPKDDPDTKEDETEVARDLLYANQWAKIKAEAIRKLNGDIDFNAERTKYVQNRSANLYHLMDKQDQNVMNAIRVTSLPTEGAAAEVYGVTALINKIKDNQFIKNEDDQNRIIGILTENNFDYNAVKLADQQAASILFEAQKDWYVEKRHVEYNKGAFIATRYLEQLQDPLNFTSEMTP